VKYWRETAAIANRILTELIHRRRNLIFWSVFPLTLLWINAVIISERTKIPLKEAMTYIAPSSLVGAALFFSCLGGSVSTVVAEREQKTLKRLFLSPLSGLSYFLGIFLAHLTIAFVQTVLVYLMAASFGSQFQGSLFLGILILILSVISYVGVGFILGTQLAKRTEDVNTIIATFGVPLLIIGGSFIPARFFPKVLLNMAQFDPIYHMNEALIGVWFRGNTTIEEIEIHFDFLLIFSLLMLLFGWLSYKGMLIIERRL